MAEKQKNHFNCFINLMFYKEITSSKFSREESFLFRLMLAFPVRSLVQKEREETEETNEERKKDDEK